MLRTYIVIITSVALSACASRLPTASGPSRPGAECERMQFNGHPDAADECQTGCEAGDGAHCAMLGEMYAAGHLVGENPKMAAHYAERGCELSDGLACYNAATFKEAQGEPTAAIERLARACEEGLGILSADELGSACFRSGYAYYAGRGVEVDEERSHELLSRACDQGRKAACDAFEPGVSTASK